MTTLYRFWDADGGLLYVGITGVGALRWVAHARTKDWWRRVVRVTVEHFDDRASALAAETQAIRTERPRYNVIGIRPAAVKVGGFRAHGSGSVYLRSADKRWVASLPSAMGRATKTFDSRQEAERYLADTLGLEYEGEGEAVEIDRDLIAEALRRIGVDDAIAPALFTAYLEAWLDRPDEEWQESGP